MREWVDFQFLDETKDPSEGLEELIRYRADKVDSESVRGRLQPGQLYEVTVNRLGWDKVPVIYRGKIGPVAKA